LMKARITVSEHVNVTWLYFNSRSPQFGTYKPN
jgi:hypothetical protein